MPYYSYQCNGCGALKGDVRSIEQRHDGPTCHICKTPNMRLVIDPVRGIVKDPAVPKGRRPS